MSSPKVWPSAVALLLVLMAAIQITAALQETQTYDEAGHLAAGYVYLGTGDYTVDPDHPPLSRIAAALPLLFLHPSLPPRAPGADHRMVGALFLYRNRVPPDPMLFAARSTTIAVSLLLGLAIALWTRRHFGALAALAALVLYILDPNVLAHGRYVTTDLPAACATFLACLAWGAFLSRRSRATLLLAGAALGAALATKFSSLFLLPVLVALYFIRWWQDGAAELRAPKLGWKHLALSLAALCAMAAAVVALAYAPDTARILAHPAARPPLAASIQRNTIVGEALYRAGQILHLPAYPYLVGLESVARHGRVGQPSYLLGQSSDIGGWWYYFPVAFLVKSPVALLLACLIALGAGVAWLVPPRRLRRLRTASFDWFLLAAPPGVYLALSLHSRLNIGVRHLLPAYPFLLVLVSAGICAALRARRRTLVIVLAALVALEAAEAAAIYPYHLSFFNFLAGGPARGPDYLLDSNIDWGQDILHLRRWLDRHGHPPVCLAYFGTADTAYYGIPNNGIPTTDQVRERAAMNCIAAISVTLLHDLYLKPGAYQWLRDLHPIARAGYSIYLYDLRRGS